MFLPPLNRIDYYRLHCLIEKLEKGELIYRGEGATVARLFLMFGEVELGDEGNQYLYIGENSWCAKEAAQSFLTLIYDVYPEMKESLTIRLEPDWRPDLVLLPNHQMYRFFSVDQLIINGGQCLYGFRFDKVYFDVSIFKQQALEDRDTGLISMLEYLYNTGAEIV